MNEPKYGVKYVCAQFPNAVLGRKEPSWKYDGLHYDFIIYTPDMKRYTGYTRVHKDAFNQEFKELV